MFPPFNEMPITYSACGIIILLSSIGFYSKPLRHALIFHPYAVYKGIRLHTLFTSAFVHNSWWHLGFNIYIFYGCVRDVEYVILENDFTTTQIKGICLLLIFLGVTLPNICIGFFNKRNVNFTSVGFSGAVFCVAGFTMFYKPLDHLNEPGRLLPILYYAYQIGFTLFLVMILLVIVFRNSKTNHKLHLVAFVIGLFISIVCRPVLIDEIIIQLIK